MIDTDQFDHIVRDIVRPNNLDEDTAAKALSLTGDTPNLDDGNKAIAKPADGHELRIQMPQGRSRHAVK